MSMFSEYQQINVDIPPTLKKELNTIQEKKYLNLYTLEKFNF